MKVRTYLVAGNWKMNGTRVANGELLEGVLSGISSCPGIEVLVCPPSVYLESVASRLNGTSIALGAQNLCEQTQPGAFTGELFSGMLTDVGCRYVLVGHSERRALYGEDDLRVAQKFVAALAGELIPVLCVGETLSEREAGQTEAVLARQLAAVISEAGVGAFAKAVIAYEPVWAIGTGRTATAAQAQEAHAFIRSQISAIDANIANSVRILYGGSVKADNALALFACADVDGGLIGGASLKAADFLAICNAAQSLVQ